jgi:hypothetical protein
MEMCCTIMKLLNKVLTTKYTKQAQRPPSSSVNHTRVGAATDRINQISYFPKDEEQSGEVYPVDEIKSIIRFLYSLAYDLNAPLGIVSKVVELFVWRVDNFKDSSIVYDVKEKILDLYTIHIDKLSRELGDLKVTLRVARKRLNLDKNEEI